MLAAATTPTFGSPVVPACGADASSLPATSYVSVRHLEARTENGGRYGWMDVRTTLTADQRFVYEVLQEGGSSQIRERALAAALKREQELVSRGAAVHMPALLTSYACGEAEPDSDGLLRVAIRPRQPSKHLVNGTLLLDPQSGAVLRMSGALSRSPSFWVSEVEMDWTYAPVAGVVLPTAVEARARVKIVGRSTFSMTYRYLSVGGRPVGDGAETETSTIDRRQ